MVQQRLNIHVYNFLTPVNRTGKGNEGNKTRLVYFEGVRNYNADVAVTDGGGGGLQNVNMNYKFRSQYY
jgi:hypothetical protein